MIDVLDENLIDLKEACSLPPFRRNGRPCHVSSLYRFVLHGAKDASGNRQKLETVRVPAGLRTSTEAVARFIERLTSGDEPMPSVRTSRRRQADIERANRELEMAGI